MSGYREVTSLHRAHEGAGAARERLDDMGDYKVVTVGTDGSSSAKKAVAGVYKVGLDNLKKKAEGG